MAEITRETELATSPDTLAPELEEPLQDSPEVAGIAVHGLTSKPLSPSLLAWRRFRRHKIALISAAVLLVFAVLIYLPGIITDYGPQEIFREAGERPLRAPSGDHWFGTNTIGQDQFTRVLHAGQISLSIGLAVALVSAVIGTIVGAVAGFYGRWVDNVMMRVTDLFLAMPLLVVLILVGRLPDRNAWAETIMGPTGSVRAIIFILAAFFWMPLARVVRGVVLSLKEKEFVEAARALGGSNTRIMGRHLVPNCMGPIIVNITLGVAAAILTESALSFLGFGVQAAVTPTWGNMLNGVEGYTRTAPWVIWFPGLAIVLTVLCVNYLGDGLRDALDPRQRRDRA